MQPLRIATRGSELALWQAKHVASLVGGDVELVVVETTGDRHQDAPIWDLGGRGVFVKEVQAAVLDGAADIAVHSAKDLTTTAVPGLVIGAVTERADPRDALVGGRLSDLPPGAMIGTGSIRRRAQLAHLRPDLTFGSLRGNIATRLAKASEFSAVVVAVAALQRLGLHDSVAEVLEPSAMLPQVAQGALAVECRAGDEVVLGRVAAIEHRDSRRAVDAERAFLACLGGGCDLPVGAYARVRGADIRLEGLVASLDGHIVLRHVEEGDDPFALGAAVARHLLDGAGGRWLLDGLRSRLPA